MRVVISKNRAAQLDLLLRSLDRFAWPEPTWAVVNWTDDDYRAGYELCERDHPEVRFLPEGSLGGWEFERAVRFLLEQPDAGAFVTFLCDDDVIYRTAPSTPVFAALLEPEVLCFSLRLGANTLVQYPTGFRQHPPAFDLGPWPWRLADGDFAYPGSIDGHVFRAADLRTLLDGAEFPNPTALECVLADRLAAGALPGRPLMSCYPESVLVGLPVNRVSTQSNVRYGERVLRSAYDLNLLYTAGRRIALDSIPFDRVVGAHTELPFDWKRAPTRRDIVSGPQDVRA